MTFGDSLLGMGGLETLMEASPPEYFMEGMKFGEAFEISMGKERELDSRGCDSLPLNSGRCQQSQMQLSKPHLKRHLDTPWSEKGPYLNFVPDRNYSKRQQAFTRDTESVL